MFGTETNWNSKPPLTHSRLTFPGIRLRRLLFVCLVLASTGAGTWLMYDIVSPNGLLPLEMVLVVLFAVTFGWITQAFWSALFGFVLQGLHIDPLTLRRIRETESDTIPFMPTTRTAVVMPVYNEDTLRVAAGFESCVRSLQRTGALASFDFYWLSDTTDPLIIQAEEKTWRDLRKRLGDLARHTFYRRREKNIGRKVGNVADFCQRWGSHYEQMIVLDADSVMTGKCMLTLVQEMEANPRVGLVQTVPLPVRQQTLFGRFLQFAGTLYSPMLATGMAFWQADVANYWGHNAVIRIKPFMDHCGLPKLAHRFGPFSGDILSHDFVEAAMLRRAGWQVVLRADLEGSYEELPSNILDYATRDRRWAEGNIQHLSLLTTRGFHWISRLHFLFGAVAYLSSVVWMLMLVLSSADAIQRALTKTQFFTHSYQLFPEWPIAKSEQVMSLFAVTAALLLMPKVLGVILALFQRRKQFGGGLVLIIGALLETLFAILIAPLMMLFHSTFILFIFLGKKTRWNAQAREGRMVAWLEAMRRSGLHTILAVGWGAVTWIYAPLFFWWLTPVLSGLILAAPLIRYSSSLRMGRILKRFGILCIPAELHMPLEIRALQRNLNSPKDGESPMDWDANSELPPVRWQPMPVNTL